MNPVLILSRNTLELTRRCVESVDAQSIPTKIFLIDNGSTDRTKEWWRSSRPPENATWWDWQENRGVSKGWNEGLRTLFNQPGVDYVLVCNSDTVLPPWFYRRILELRPRSFITGVSVGTMAEIVTEPPEMEPTASPDFSCFLIAKSCWERVGKFSEQMVHYASDNDYHLRMHRAGIIAFNSGLPFFHERSSTLRLAAPKDRRLIELQADADRVVFREKWGFDTWSPQYAAAFSPETFGVDHPTIKEMQDQ